VGEKNIKGGGKKQPTDFWKGLNPYSFSERLRKQSLLQSPITERKGEKSAQCNWEKRKKGKTQGGIRLGAGVYGGGKEWRRRWKEKETQEGCY